MSAVQVMNETRRVVLGDRVQLADTILSRSLGFLLKPAPSDGEGLLLSPCKGVHMYGMRFPLDVIMVDHSGVVVAVHERLPAWSRTPVYRSAHYALELPAGSVASSRTRVGDRLSWRPAPGGNPGTTAGNGAKPTEVVR